MGTDLIGSGAVNGQIAIQQARNAQMLQQLNSAKAADNTAKIEKGAKQFEAMLLSTWLEQAEHSFATVPGAEDGDEDEPGRDQMMSYGVQSLSQSLVDSGGIGMAKMIAKAMEAQVDRAESSTKTNPAAAGSGQNPVRNLSFRLNSGGESADSSAGSETREK
jgi:Rod binding domain-containing protein